jgi:hypothetical protein
MYVHTFYEVFVICYSNNYKYGDCAKLRHVVNEI